MSRNWLDIDVKGFAQTLTDKGVARIVMEPIANALDTEATTITVDWSWEHSYLTLEVVDDDPTGFSRLADAYTLFAPSIRKGDASKRGRFSLGEKELIAICVASRHGFLSICSTTGTVLFDQSGRHESREKTQAGTILRAKVRMTVSDLTAFENLLGLLLVPPTVQMSINCQVVASVQPFSVVSGVLLDTVTTNDEGELVRTKRQTNIEVFDVPDYQTPMVFELGVPVVEHDGKFHVNVLQKVPLNRDRDNITPAYRRALNAAVVEVVASSLTTEDVNKSWVRDVIPDMPDAVAKDLFVKRFGEKTVIYDPTDIEASKRLQDEGYTVIYGRSLSADEHHVVRATGVFKPAGQVRPSGVKMSPGGKPPIDPSQWTPAMTALATYSTNVAKFLLDEHVDVRVQFYNISRSGWAGCADREGFLAFNIGTLGRAWVESPKQEAVDALLLHELVHVAGINDHFSDRFYNTLARFGAKLRTCPEMLVGAAH